MKWLIIVGIVAIVLVIGAVLVFFKSAAMGGDE